MTDLSTPTNPRCRYCGQRRSTTQRSLRSKGLPVLTDPAICPIDGHAYPPAVPDCRGCAGACITCEQPGAPLPCPDCGWTGVDKPVGT